MDVNLSSTVAAFPAPQHVFDIPWVRALFITLHVIVFCGCFFGNLFVIIVVTWSKKLRSITNFLLANLAVADLCVGVFCVFQNLYIYFTHSWLLGDTICKMSQFVHSLSYTASILILVLICSERYVAIIHPMTCRRILTPNRLTAIVTLVWLTSAALSSPRLIWMKSFQEPGGKNIICVPNLKSYDFELFDVVNFFLLYVLPLVMMTYLYSRIAIVLWRSSNGLGNGYCHQPSMRIRLARRFLCHRCVLEADPPSSSAPSHHVLQARRSVVRMLIALVLTFAICNLPLHARKMWQHWSPSYKGATPFSAILSPVTFLVTYVNSALDPLLYAFLSANFRRVAKELFCGVLPRNQDQIKHLAASPTE